jgi:hypothetical protein
LSKNNSDGKKYKDSQILAVENKNYTHSDDLLSEASNITTALLFIFRENIPTDGTSSKFWKKIIIAPSSKILL